MRTNHKKGDKSTSQHYHESELWDDQPRKKKKGKYISVFESHLMLFDIDDPIAIRKPVRSCTKYPISNFILYSNLLFSHHYSLV